MMNTNKQGLVWGTLLIILGMVSLLETFANLAAWVWIAALVLGSAMTYRLYKTDHTAKWVLVVSYGLLVIAVLVTALTLNLLPGKFVATFVLLAVSLPFLVVFQERKQQEWAWLIPAYVLIAVAMMVPLITTGVLTGVSVAVYVLIAIAVACLIAYTRLPKQWWLVILGGITAIVGVSLLISLNAARYMVPTALIIVGVGVIIRAYSRSVRVNPKINRSKN